MIEFRDRMARGAGASTSSSGPIPRGKRRQRQPVRLRHPALHPRHEDGGAQAGARPLRVRRGLRRSPPRRGEASRAKERIFSFRDRFHQWDPKNQRPELWNLYNTRIGKGESIRVFPLSNWTELDVWLYIQRENIPIVPLYLAAERPVVEREGTLIMVDDDRMPLAPGETPSMRRVRFRTLGCYPLTGAVESDADTVAKIIEEMLVSRVSERQGRVIDYDEAGSMEEKKREGYF
jgi:sulfate adenylyltransferase subunit 2